MDGISSKRQEVINRWFIRADLVLRRIYQPDVNKKLEWNEEVERDVKSISVSYLANYVGIIDPSLKPALLQIVARLADLEIAEKDDVVGDKRPSLKLMED